MKQTVYKIILRVGITIYRQVVATTTAIITVVVVIIVMWLIPNLFVSLMPFSLVMVMPTAYSLHYSCLQVHRPMRYNVPSMNSPHWPDKKLRCMTRSLRCWSAPRRRCFLETPMGNSSMKAVVVQVQILVQVQVQAKAIPKAIFTLQAIRRVMEMSKRVKT